MTKLSIEPAFSITAQGQITTEPVVIDVHHPHPGALKLPNQVLMPGFVNAHSHVFQRLLRGLVEKTTLADNTFWSWREAMYRLANRISPDDLLIIAQLVYIEMLEAGFTHVGEFHYLHHDVGGKYFGDAIAMSRSLARAAKESHINLCLLSTAYNLSNFNTPALPEQHRFIFDTCEAFLAHARLVRQQLTEPAISAGIAIHSVRAVPDQWFAPILDEITTHNLPLHIHASEQIKEVNDCIKATHHSPISWLDKHHLLAPTTTLIHATQLTNDDVPKLLTARPLIAICPSTERNLGDGIVALRELFLGGLKICVGTDQHVRLDPFHEAQCLEEHERLRLNERSILNRDGDWLYKKLLRSLITNGMTSLYPTFDDKAEPTSFIGIELPPEYEWHGPEVGMEALFLAANSSHIKTVISNGNMVVKDGFSTNPNKIYLHKEIRDFIKR